jgi:long-chain-fatty-acid---luciferin-component ligase
MKNGYISGLVYSMTSEDFQGYIRHLDERLQKYIPPPSTWGPVENALYRPKDLYRIPLKEAAELQLHALRDTFKHHYEVNRFYHGFCKENGVSPEDIKTQDDLMKIPLIPDGFFKDYPHGKEFATWLGNVYSGELPQITINQVKPTFDQVIDSFNDAGILVTFSSGTGGRHTFIPRDQRTFYASEYALAKSLCTMIYPFYEYDIDGYLLMPNPKKTHIYAGKALEVYGDAVKSIHVAIDRRITTELIQITMGGRKGMRSRMIRLMSRRATKQMIDNIISWLDHHATTKQKISLVGAPWILYFVMEKLKKEGKSFDFGERGIVATGGGWKVYEDRRLSLEEFRKEVEDVLGIPEKYCLDVYGMVEGNGWMIHCPEGHYLHVPYSYFKPLVLDEEFEPVGYGETGRFAFLDATTASYPGFITTGDRVKLLEHCPVCDRPGPVLEPEVTRVQGMEMRGCAEEMRSMMSRDMGR